MSLFRRSVLIACPTTSYWDHCTIVRHLVYTMIVSSLAPSESPPAFNVMQPSYSGPFPRLTKRSLHAGLRAVRNNDPDIAEAFALVGSPPAVRVAEDGFAGLLRIIVGQQISSAAARAIWNRILASVVPLNATTLIAMLDSSPEILGLSRPKRSYARGLGEAIILGTIDPDRFPAQDNDAIVRAIIALKGFGRWSAEVYLLLALGRRDAWPADDLALAVAIQRIKRLPSRPKRQEMDRIAEPWRPWRGAVAMFLWHYYHVTGGQRQFAAEDRPHSQSPEIKQRN